MGCMGRGSLGLDGLLYELYSNVPGFFAGPLADVYCNWQQNERILKLRSSAIVEKGF